MESPSSVFSAWSVFYTLTGSSAAALTGLTFVIITLIKGGEQQTSTDGVATFSTPTVVHFAVALMVSGLLCAPWPTLLWPSAILAIAGAGGVSYEIRILLKARRVTVYTPDLEDWIWYTILPMVAYAIILAGAIGLAIQPAGAAYAPAAAVALLILVGIHNSWDVVTYLTFSGPSDRK